MVLKTPLYLRKRFTCGGKIYRAKIKLHSVPMCWSFIPISGRLPVILASAVIFRTPKIVTVYEVWFMSAIRFSFSHSCRPYLKQPQEFWSFSAFAFHIKSSLLLLMNTRALLIGSKCPSFKRFLFKPVVFLASLQRLVRHYYFFNPHLAFLFPDVPCILLLTLFG